MTVKNTGYELKYVVENYVKYRPKIPPQLHEQIFAYLDRGSESNGRRDLAVDVGCGSGQSTLPLCSQFKSVTGIDPSEAQLDEAKQLCADHNNVVFKLGSAETISSSFEKDSVDLVTVGTALHWFDLEVFFKNCLQILKADGVLAAYSLNFICWDNQQANDIINRQIFRGPFEPYWKVLGEDTWDNCTETISLMKLYFEDSARDESLNAECNYSIEDVFGYMKSFPNYFDYKNDHPEHPDEVDNAIEKLKTIFGTTSMQEKVVKGVTPISLLIGRKSSYVS